MRLATAALARENAPRRYRDLAAEAAPIRLRARSEGVAIECGIAGVAVVRLDHRGAQTFRDLVITGIALLFDFVAGIRAAEADERHERSQNKPSYHPSIFHDSLWFGTASRTSTRDGGLRQLSILGEDLHRALAHWSRTRITGRRPELRLRPPRACRFEARSGPHSGRSIGGCRPWVRATPVPTPGVGRVAPLPHT